MDSTSASGPHRSRTKLLSRLAKLGKLDVVNAAAEVSPNLELVNSPSLRKNPSPSSTNHSLRSSLPLQELLLSPSPYKRSKTRLADRLEAADEAAKRCKNRGGNTGLSGGASPRVSRRSRRRSEMEGRDDFVEEVARPRRRRNSGRSRKEKLSLVPVITTSSSFSKIDDGDYDRNLDLIGQAITDLVMWRDAAKSSLWFGFGCLCFMSSSFTAGISISIFAAICQLGLLFLVFSFFSNSICRRTNVEIRRNFKLTEDDVLRAARLILPATNLAIAKARELFSGEPSMTLKVAPLLLLGAEYGHLLTMRRFCAIGFFISFGAPKLYSHYSNLITERAESGRNWVCGRWSCCNHKKVVAVSASMAFWNLSSVKTRILTAFISVVILRYCRQHSQLKLEEAEVVVVETAEIEDENDEQQQQQALVVVAERNSRD